MKTLRLASTALLTAGLLATSTHAASNRTLNGALLGGVAGAIIGNNSGDGNGLKGAVIGTAAGALIGSATERHRDSYESRYYSSYRHRPVYSYPSNHYHLTSRYPRSSYYVQHQYTPRPSYANRGLIIGGLSGAIIGNNSRHFRHDSWRGAAWGAGAGWLLGTWADSRYDSRRCYDNNLCNPVPTYRTDDSSENTSTRETTSADNRAAQTIIYNITNNYNTTPMTSANGLFGR